MRTASTRCLNIRAYANGTSDIRLSLSRLTLPSSRRPLFKGRGYATAPASGPQWTGEIIYEASPELDLPGRKASKNRFARDTVPLRYQAFQSLNSALQQLEIQLRQSRPYGDFGLDAERFWHIFDEFRHQIIKDVKYSLQHSSAPDPLKRQKLARQIIASAGNHGKIQGILKVHLYNKVMDLSLTKQQLQRHMDIADCRYPMEWFSRARSMKRVLHLHIGPTNSGKTYHALKKLEMAESGCYAGPLRLLAQEVYARLNAKGKPTWLITGDDQQLPSINYSAAQEKKKTISCTVEMTDLFTPCDVAVIDEVQMAADSNRGYAWTTAILGIPAKEVHLCGEERSLLFVEKLARALGEKLIIHRYKRLSPLAVMQHPISGLSDLVKGDCVVCFSIMRIQAMKQQIEKITGRRCAMIYGSLPAEVRSQQARLFNDPDNEFDYLVASDAVGMGLNLAIVRVIFDTVHKRTRDGNIPLSTPEIRQIGGRAGRYRTSFQAEREDSAKTRLATSDTEESEESEMRVSPSAQPCSSASPDDPNLGMVTAFEHPDLESIQSSMITDPGPITKIGVFPTNDMIAMLYTYFPVGIPYSFILARLLSISKVNDDFFFVETVDLVLVADIIQPVKDLPIMDRIKICFAPISVRTRGLPELMLEMAHAVANQARGALLELRHLDFSVMDEPLQQNYRYLGRLENLHKALILYNWMSFRFPGVFNTRPLAIKTKEVVEQRIDACLSTWRYDDISKSRATVKQTDRLRVVSSLLDHDGQQVENKIGQFPEHDTGLVASLGELHELPFPAKENYLNTLSSAPASLSPPSS